MRAWFAALVLVTVGGVVLTAADRAGHVTFGGLPVPGATITATRDTTQFVTSTDQEGVYRLTNLAEGVWTIRVEMFGFATVTHTLTVPADAQLPVTELRLLPFEQIASNLPTRLGRWRNRIAISRVPFRGFAYAEAWRRLARTGVRYGTSFNKPSWAASLVETRDDVRIIGLKERGWMDFQDVLMVQKRQ